MQESKKSLEQVEKEQFTRRQALRKFGFGAGLSAFMLLGADDLARMVGQKMQQMDGDNRVADKIAREFRSAGLAFANGPSGPVTCTDCEQHYQDCTHCYCNTLSPSAITPCYNNQAAALNACAAAHCPGGIAPGPYPPANCGSGFDSSYCA